MAIATTELVALMTKFSTDFPYLSLHTTGAVTSSANESSAARVSAGWAVNAGTGATTFTNKAFTGGAASGPSTRVGYWSASTGGTYGGGFLLSGDQVFASDGTYTVTSGQETITSS